MDDFESCIEMDLNSQVTKYIPGVWNGSFTHIAFVKERILKLYPQGFGYWSVFLKENPNDFIGWVHLIPVLDDKKVTEIGWRLKYSAWGNGYATEAVRVLIIYAFKIADFNRIVAYTHFANNRSIKMMDRLGFKYVTDFIYDGKVPSLFYELRREKYL